ncbi:helix-turn-helix domain-containing protein [Streptomyces oceani]|uniref:DNA-binding protein n=1 Tax=Streptomyces oceani TaxID=1075402 RepID=A0A1E7JW73_9ACTN|nr:helix-turn-helix transcriptional regulator [Streptomyces oceani]OEU95773.1 DNA-binding protein [Streptomyces oceani]
MEQNGQPPVAWRYCGNQLKLWRTGAGVTREQLGEAARYSPDTVKSMEQGARMPTPQLLDAADDLLCAGGKLRAATQYLRREKFPARSQDFMAYEAAAVSLWSYEVSLVPGLLQTRAYAERLIGGHSPPLDDMTVEERVNARLERQSILGQRPPTAFSFVIYEAVLRCPLGGTAVYKGQLAHLLEMSARRNVSIQVLPFERAVPAALSGPMVLLESRDFERPAFVEGQSMSQLISDPEKVNTLTQRHGMIRMQALSAEESERFIKRMVDEL